MNNLPLLPLLPKLENAACKDYEFPDLFFPAAPRFEERNLAFAQAICNNCVEAKKCLEFALEQDIRHGIWAGTTPQMRQNMKVGITATSIHPQTVADRIRSLHAKGKSPRQIAFLLNQDHSYVMLALSRKSRNKGEIQSTVTTENFLDDSSSSSGSAS